MASIIIKNDVCYQPGVVAKTTSVINRKFTRKSQSLLVDVHEFKQPGCAVRVSATQIWILRID